MKLIRIDRTNRDAITETLLAANLEKADALAQRDELRAAREGMDSTLSFQVRSDDYVMPSAPYSADNQPAREPGL